MQAASGICEANGWHGSYGLDRVPFRVTVPLPDGRNFTMERLNDWRITDFAMMGLEEQMLKKPRPSDKEREKTEGRSIEEPRELTPEELNEVRGGAGRDCDTPKYEPASPDA